MNPKNINFRMKFRPNIFHMLMWINIMLIINLMTRFFQVDPIISNVLIYLVPFLFSLLMELKIRYLDFEDEEEEFNLISIRELSIGIFVVVVFLYIANILGFNTGNY